MIYEISTVVAVVGFIVLVGFIISTLISIKKSVEKVVNSIDAIEKKTGPLSLETTLLLKKWNDVTSVVKDQLHAFNPIFNSVHHLGKWLENSSEDLNPDHYSLQKMGKVSSKRNQKILTTTIELLARSILLWQEIKRR